MPLTRDQIIASCIYWGIWIFGLFLIPELLGWGRVAPWVTLSETAWWVEKALPIMRSLLFGFLIGLAVHIRFHTNFGRAELGGMIVAAVAHLIWGLA